MQPAGTERLLLEREVELDRLSAALEDSLAASGTAVVVQGPAGIGKTALLEAIRDAGRAAGALALWAAAADLEQRLAFGVVRQLFEHHVRRLDQAARDALFTGASGLARSVVLDSLPGPPRADAVNAAMHGLYWLAAELAAQRPVLLVVDDAHWSDAASLRWLAYLARRLDGVPLLLVVGCRDAEPGSEGTLLDHVMAEARGGILRPRPLTPQAVGRWLQQSYGHQPEPEFAAACTNATGGNPFLLSELTTALRVKGLGPDVAASKEVPHIAPQTLSRSLRLRLGRLGPLALSVTEAVAVLTADARLDAVAEVANVTLEEAGDAIDRAAAAGILTSGDPVGFVHPLLRSAVYDDIPDERRGGLHLAAARRLVARTDGLERGAQHLLLAAPSGQDWAVDALQAAGAAAVARGAPDLAIPLLGRALAESRSDRADLLVALAGAEALARQPVAAVEHSRAATMQTSAKPGEHAQAALVGARILFHWGRIGEALELLRGAQHIGDRLEPAKRREVEVMSLMVSAAVSATDLRERLAAFDLDAISGEAPADRGLLALGAMDLIVMGHGRDKALGHIERLLSWDDPPQPANEWVMTIAARVLAIADRVDDARSVANALIRRAQDRGASTEAVNGYTLRSEVEHRAGRLAEAEADAHQALELLPEPEVWARAMALRCMVDVIVERSDGRVALDVLATHGMDHGVPVPTYTLGAFLHARGHAAALAGDLDRAVSDYRAAGDLVVSWGEVNPAAIPWRSSLALALNALGEAREARDLAEQELALAQRFGAARPVGIALRARALLDGGDRGIAGLREAVETLAQSPARLEHARALVDFGAALRRAGQRREARGALEAGLDGAHRCGAHRLTARARDELRAAGARPRRERLRGVEALTASELRVAKLAAEGLTNRQIAQALFVTTKTVEMHLARAYPKLGVARRTELSRSLGPAP